MKAEEKSQAEMEIEALADIFGIATTGFEDFYKSARKDTASGDGSTAASSGYGSKAASSGDGSTAASSGYGSTAASSGEYSKAASSGDGSTAASSGEYSKAASSGYGSKAASSGEYSACAAVGYRAAVKGDIGNLLMASEYIKNDGNYIPVGGRADLVDGKTLKPDCWYIVEGGKWVEVDFTDGVFSYVLSNKKGIKKVKTEKGDILFVVSDDKGNSSHGKTISEARADLIYKAVAREDVEIPEKATGTEWCAIYRAVTGACSAGVRAFVEESGQNINELYTVEEISALVQGRYNAQLFYDRIKQREIGKPLHHKE